MEKLLSDKYMAKKDEYSIITHTASEVEPVHTHEFIELVYILNGHGHHCIEGESYKVGKGDLLFINPGQTHSFVPEAILDYVNILIKPEFFDKNTIHKNMLYQLFHLFIYQDAKGVEKTKPLVEFRGIDLVEVERLIKLAVSEFNTRKFEYEMICDLYIQLLILRAIRWLKENGNKNSHGDADYDDIMVEVLEFINNEYQEKISLNDIAKKYFYNHTYFSRMFKNYCGKCFTEVLQMKRIKEAAELLTETDMSVDDILISVGFVNKKLFYKLFREGKGCTPKEYRQKNKKD